MKVLSTKKLTDKQLAMLSDYEVVEAPMISIVFGKDFQLEEPITNAVFTSANSVRAVFDNNTNNKSFFDTVFCVGTKTQSLLEDHGITVTATAPNALELADVIAKRFAQNPEAIKEISWFCGNLRNDDLPAIMAESGVLVTEYIVYKTHLTPVKVADDFDAILFFSPSGVKSFVKENPMTTKPVVCIGTTTAVAALDYFENTYIAETTTVEGVIEKMKETI